MKLKKHNCVRAVRAKQSRHSEKLVHALNIFEKGEALECQRTLRSILRLEPDHVGALELLARCQWRNSDFDSALATIAGLIQLNPYEPGYFYLRGLIHQSLGQVALAVSSFERCRAFPDSDLAAKAEESIRELHAWQQQGLQQLIELDADFRIRFLQDSDRALAERGLIPDSSGVDRRLTVAESTPIHIYDRPS